MKTSDILAHAADILDRQGWTQDQTWEYVKGLAPKDRPLDVAGAINVAAGAHPAEQDHEHACDAAEFFARHVGLTFGAVISAYDVLADWNDQAGRTKDEVVAKLRAASREAREAGR